MSPHIYSYLRFSFRYSVCHAPFHLDTVYAMLLASYKWDATCNLYSENVIFSQTWPTIHSQIQSTLVISNSKGPSETLRDISTSTYQMCRIEEYTTRTTKFHKWTCNLTPLVRNVCWNIVERGEIAPEEQFLLLSTIFFYLMLDFSVKTEIKFCLRVKRLFEITEVKITRVDCMFSNSIRCKANTFSLLYYAPCSWGPYRSLLWA